MQAARGASLTGDGDAAGTGDDVPAGDVPAGVHRVRPRRRTVLLLVVAAVVLALDALTKVLVVARVEGGEPLSLLGGRLLIRVSRNPGAAFSFAEGATLLFTVIAATVVVVILRVSRRLRSVGWALSLGLLLGGAAGNLVDRLLRAPGPGRGAVVDFIDFQVWPSFNVADTGIVVGGLLAVVLSFRGVEVDGTRTGKHAAGGSAHPPPAASPALADDAEPETGDDGPRRGADPS